MNTLFNTESHGSRFVFPLVVIAALFLPFVLSGYETFQATQILIYAMVLLGLNMLTGFNGQISLGHGAFFAIGAYVAALLMDQFGMVYWLTLPIAGLACLVFGFLFGLPALRLDGLYLALMTFAFGVVVPQVLRHKSIGEWTGGVEGLMLTKPEAPFGLPLTADQWLFFFTLAITVVMFVIGKNLLKGRIGRAWLAVRDHPVAAASMGINTAFYKTAAFGVSAMYTGVAGALSAIVVAYVAPDSFTPFLSISLLVGIVVGGLATISGAIYGAIFIQIVPNLAASVSQAAPWAVYGLLLLLFTLAMPGGIAGLVNKVFSWTSFRRPLLTENQPSVPKPDVKA